MDDIIKSALEIAMEKVEKLDEATDEERLEWRYRPQGEELAVKYLNEDSDLLLDVSEYAENVKKYLIGGATGILVRNISLPKNDVAKKANHRSMDGLKLLKNDKVEVENIYSKIRYLFTHYEEQGKQQREEAYQSLKADLTAKIQQAMQQQMGQLMSTKIDVEKQPQFQQEWRKLQTQLDSAYINHLNECKRELSDIE